VEGQTAALVKKSDEVMRRLKKLHIFSDQSMVDTSASKFRTTYLQVFHGTINNSSTSIHHSQVQGVSRKFPLTDTLLYYCSLASRSGCIHGKSIETSVVFFLTSTVKLKVAFIVPYAPNPSFLGQQGIITVLDQHFTRENKAGQITTKKSALCGLGGIG
jgi:hypothetical protein